MSQKISLSAHGGCGLINRVIPQIKRNRFAEKALKRKTYTISDDDLATFYRIADGTMSPLEGPMDEAEFYHVLEKETIQRNGKQYAWTIPIAFPIGKEDKKNLKRGETVAVKNERGVVVGLLEIADLYRFDKKKYNKSVYGTTRTDHPGPRIANSDKRNCLLGGKIWSLPPYKHPEYGKYMLSPKESRALFKKRKWEKIVAFQTRNPLHRAHEYAMVYAMENLTQKGFFTGVVLNPLVGKTKKDDVPPEIRMKTYETLLRDNLLGHGDQDYRYWRTKKYNLNDNIALIALDIKMFYAGPKEAVMHAIYRQNHGFSHIIIGRRHADAPFDDKTQLWGDFAAQEKFNNLKGELLIEPLKIGFAAYFEELGRVDLVEKYKKTGFNQINISGNALRHKLRKGEPVDERIIRKPVANILAEFYHRNNIANKKNTKNYKIASHDSTAIKKQKDSE